MIFDIQQEDFIRLLEILNSFPDVTVLDSGFKDPATSTYIITAGEWTEALKEKINDEFPGLMESIVSCPIHRDVESEKEFIDQESSRAPAFFNHGLQDNGDIA